MPVFELGHADDVVEGRALLLVADPTVLHIEPGEHGGVELAAGALAGHSVGVAAAGGDGGGKLQDLLPLGEVGVEVAQAVLCGSEVGADAGLFGFEGGDVDGAAVVGVEQLAPCGLGLGDPSGEQLPLGDVGPLALDHLGGELLAQALGPGGRQLDGRVELLNLVFEVVSCDAALPTGALGVDLLAEAEEIRVAALGVLDRQVPSAHPAVQDAFQVVGVLAFARPAHRAGGEQLLDPAKGLGCGERLVEAGVLDPTPTDDAGVDGVGEDLGQTLPGDRLEGSVPPPPVGKATMSQLASQAVEGPVAAGAGRPRGVGFDCSGLTQAAYRVAGVTLPRTAQEQYDAGPLVPAGAPLQPGDLVFFGQGPSDVTHVGIYVGVQKGQAVMVDAPHSGAEVRVEPFPDVVGQSWDGERYLGATGP